MTTLQVLNREFEQEAEKTRKMLSIIPDEHFSWRPHDKSMSVQQLATHISEIPGWVEMLLTTEELDFGKNHTAPPSISTTADLLVYFEECVQKGKAQLEKASEADLLPNWTMRNGDVIFDVSPKSEVLRMCFSQTVHHRAQLGVYLRILDVPIPGSYGPSADEIEQHANYQAQSN